MVYLKNYSVILLLLTTLPLLATARNDDWRLVWSDEFNTEGRLSPSVWNYEQGYVRAMRRLNGISRTMQFVKEASLSSKLGKSGIVRILFTYPVVTIGVKNGNL